VEEEYISAILKEWDLYFSLMDEAPVIRELHLGGGTPTFFSPENLQKLLSGIFKRASIHPDHEFGFEGHPNNTSKEHLKSLYNLGFRRMSLGVQDNDAKVQKIINRIQPFSNVKRATAEARAIGFESVNFDLIYGLPFQTKQSIKRTVEECISLQPDRVAFYSYAHVPWTSKAQRLFDENDLPSPHEKLELYKAGKELFTCNGYVDIGMDHFALRTDALYKAWERNELHRNFMGYTTKKTNLLIGLGVSAISDVGNAFAQNEKLLHNYYMVMNQSRLPVVKGYFLNDEDIAFRKYILDISCAGKTTFHPNHLAILKEVTFPKLAGLAADGLIEWNDESLTATQAGRSFIRNICNAFDLHYLRQEEVSNERRYSNAI
jgi:oxygen-independent coproporphyrinogen-3 oxidase